jgi:hypothetical protein
MRLHQQVVTLSEIVDGSGQFLLEEAWEGRLSRCRRTLLSFPRQDEPSKTSLRLWRAALVPLVADKKTRRLKEPLGKWLRNPALSDYRCYYSPSKKMLFKRGLKEDGEWSVAFSKHAEIPARTRSQTGNNKFKPARIEWIEASFGRRPFYSR